MEFKNVARDLHNVAKDYDYHQPPDFLLKLQEWITSALRFLNELLHNLNIPLLPNTDSRGVADLMQIVVIVVGVFAAIAVILLVVSRLRQIQAQRQIALGTMIVGESPLDSAGWLDQAEQQSLEKNYREACRSVYMSTLHLLDEQKVMGFQATKTNYEYFYALKKNSAIAAAFRLLVDRVEEIWFGDRAAVEADYTNCRTQIDTIKKTLPHGVA
jgi:hypothetical protein